ncbi:abl interactor 2-like [Daphnia carinata]|uniref:abl interactor 2-like n=1 Tax=Daphnia carinata TaxID=120202 RepID=UPI00257D8AE7|nr:abl interactor 2-like [Daphnia carinata]
MADLVTLMTIDIPEGRNSLLESQTNLEKVADYCEGNYTQAQDKRVALEETKNYTTQSLASVAYQINTLAFGFLQMLDLQATQMAEMESQINHINQMVMIHKEKVARREIGVLTTNKSSSRQYKILAPANQERPIKYVRRPIDYAALDEIGHGVRIQNELPRQKRASSQGSSSSLAGMGTLGAPMMTGTLRGHSPVPPAPTSKPPTPPMARAIGTGSLSKGSREYRTPPAVAPPQVPSNYAPNYPLGHSRRERNSTGYGTLPMSHASTSSSMHQSPYNAPQMIQQTPQIGMVHPLPHGQTSAIYAPGSATYASGLERQRSYSNPPPPSPGMMNVNVEQMPLPPPSNYGTLMTNTESSGRVRSMSPPPPPLPVEEPSDNGTSNRRRVLMPVDADLPGWVPKDYIDKVMALYDYYADKEDELSFQENSIIYVLRKNDDGWWEGILDGITGLFPGNYVESCM